MAGIDDNRAFLLVFGPLEVSAKIVC